MATNTRDQARPFGVRWAADPPRHDAGGESRHDGNTDKDVRNSSILVRVGRSLNSNFATEGGLDGSNLSGHHAVELCAVPARERHGVLVRSQVDLQHRYGVAVGQGLACTRSRSLSPRIERSLRESVSTLSHPRRNRRRPDDNDRRLGGAVSRADHGQADRYSNLQTDSEKDHEPRSTLHDADATGIGDHGEVRGGPIPWRIQVLLPVALSVALSAAVIAFAPDGRDGVDLAPQATETECLPITEPKSVTQINAMVETLRGRTEFQGADVGADVLLQDGRRLWVFGDTLRGRNTDGPRFVRNSMLVFDDRCANVVIPPGGGALVPDRSDGVGYWPMSIAKVERAGYDLVGVGLQRVRGDDAPGDAAAFTNLGPAIALFIVAPGRPPQLMKVQDVGADSENSRRPVWGAAAAVHDGWVYLYGTATPGDELVFGFSLQVARVRADHLLDTSKWRYWDGSGWSANASKATELIGADGGVSQTLSVLESGGRWYAVSKRDEFLGSDLVIWSAPSPTGPFSASAPVAKIPSDLKAGRLRYMPLAHPDLLTKPGTVVVSYSQNATDIAAVGDNPFLYRPRFLRVDLP